MKLEGDTLPLIEGERVCLRPLHAGHVDDLFAIFSHPEVVRYWSSPQMRSVKEAELLIEGISTSFTTDTLYEWGVTQRGSETVIGTLTLAHLDWSNRRTEIGFSLRRESWGQGFARAAVALGVQCAFETLDLRRMEADVDPRNQASLRLLEHVGFLREGLLRERWEVAGELQDSLLMGLLRREYRAARAANTTLGE